MMIDKNRFEQIYNIITSNEVKALKNEKEKFKFLNIYEQTVDETNLQIIDLGFENLSKMIVEVVNYNYKSRFVDDIRDTVKLILELQNANSKKALKIKDIFEKESGDIMKLDFDIVVPLKEYLNLIIVNIEGLNNNQYVVIVDGLKEIKANLDNILDRQSEQAKKYAEHIRDEVFNVYKMLSAGYLSKKDINLIDVLKEEVNNWVNINKINKPFKFKNYELITKEYLEPIVNKSKADNVRDLLNQFFKMTEKFISKDLNGNLYDEIEQVSRDIANLMSQGKMIHRQIKNKEIGAENTFRLDSIQAQILIKETKLNELKSTLKFNANEQKFYAELNSKLSYIKTAYNIYQNSDEALAIVFGDNISNTVINLTNFFKGDSVDKMEILTIITRAQKAVNIKIEQNDELLKSLMIANTKINQDSEDNEIKEEEKNKDKNPLSGYEMFDSDEDEEIKIEETKVEDVNDVNTLILHKEDR